MPRKNPQIEIEQIQPNEDVPVMPNPDADSLDISSLSGTLQNQYVFEKLPIPDSKKGSILWPFDMMSIGDSWLYATDEKVNRISSAAQAYGKRTNKRFTIRKVDTGFRIWRIS